MNLIPTRHGIPAACLLVFCALSVSISAQTGEDAPVEKKPFTLNDIFAGDSLTGGAPQAIAWSPDGAHLTYLDGGELIDLDPATGKPHILVSREKLSSLSNNSASERDRDHRARYGMASYLWAPDSAHLLFDSNGTLWLYELKTGVGVNIGTTGTASGDDPKFSPDGKFVSFIKEHGLSIIRLKEPGTPSSSVTPSGNAAIINGEVDWVYAEELDVRSNYFWSPDSNRIAFLRVDESLVPEYTIPDWIPTHPTLEKQRYPQPGDPNPDVRVGVISSKGGKTVWIKIPIKAGDDYIPRFGWLDPRTLWIETLTRDHKHKSIYFAEASTGRAVSVLDLTDDTYFPEQYDIDIGKERIVLTSWADGHTHIYSYAFDPNHPLDSPAKLDLQLTRGNFDVDNVLAVDEARKVVYYSSNEGNPVEEQLWRVGFDGVRKPLTALPGVHEASISPTGGAFVDRYSSRSTPGEFSFCVLAEPAPKCHLFWSSRALEAYRFRAPEPLELKAKDGTPLYATLLLPEPAQDGATAPPASIPLILNPYGGPGFMSVLNGWPDDDLPWGAHGILFDQLLAQHGFAVLHTDNRGMGRRGRAFEQAAYHNFGPVQLEDQLTVADAVLAHYPQLDPNRQGWWGWSWGGTFTLYALTHTNRFRAGVAVAPVTDWRDYDSIYTERYLSQPAEFNQGYKDFSVVNSAAQLHGRLLLAHGTGDDNVHLENTIQFVQKLVVNDLPYDLQLYPRKTHSIAGSDARLQLYTRILAHFESWLKPSPAEEEAK